MTLIFLALGRGKGFVFEELQKERHPINVLIFSAIMCVVLPFGLPFIILGATFATLFASRALLDQLGVTDFWLIIVVALLIWVIACYMAHRVRAARKTYTKLSHGAPRMFLCHTSRRPSTRPGS